MPVENHLNKSSMTDWTTLHHAYGEATDIPALLAAISPDPATEAWDDLWSRLCHQGTVYSASFAALPALADIAAQWHPSERGQVLSLAACILISDDVHGGSRDEFLQPVESVVPILRKLCRECLAETELSTHDFIYSLESQCALEGDVFWGRELDHLVDGEFAGMCPHCEIDLYVVVGNYGYFITAEDWVPRAGSPEQRDGLKVRRGIARTSITPNKGALPEDGEELLQHAQAPHQEDVARWIRHLFGTSECPVCQGVFHVQDAIRQR